MNLHSIRGGSQKELEDKKYNIGIGISLGNKWFTTENIIELVEWALQYSKDKVIVYVADLIHAINLEVRNKIPYEKALEKADKKGNKILGEVKSEILKKISVESANRIIFVKWSEIVDDKYKQKTEYLMSIYGKETDFQNSIHNLVKSFTAKEKRQFSDTEIHRLGEYIVEELPEVINRVQMGGIFCDAYAYPFDGELPKLVEDIQKGQLFPEIKEKIMDTEPKVFLEVR